MTQDLLYPLVRSAQLWSACRAATRQYVAAYRPPVTVRWQSQALAAIARLTAPAGATASLAKCADPRVLQHAHRCCERLPRVSFTRCRRRIRRHECNWSLGLAFSFLTCGMHRLIQPKWEGTHFRRPYEISLTEELDHVGRGSSRLAEGDPAMSAQRELLAAQNDLLIPLDGDEGAVRAVIGEEELVEPALVLAVCARCPALLDDEVGRSIATERDSGPLGGKNHLGA